MKPWLVCAVAGVSFATTAQAQELSVCLRGERAPASLRRVRDEFESVGTAVSEGPLRGAPCVAVELSDAPDLLAQIEGQGVGPLTVRVSHTDDDAVAVFALRVVEATQQAWLSRRVVLPTVAPPPELETRRRWSIGAEMALMTAPGGVAPTMVPRLRVTYGTRLQTHLIAGAPGWFGAFGEGARLGVIEVGLGATAELLTSARFRLDAGLRASFLLLSGTLSHGDGVAFDQTSTGSLAGLLGASLALSSRLWIRAEIAWGATLSPLVIRIDDHLVAEWGRPLVVASVGVHWAL